jgi:NAD(P)-dependent dehydrogenase (short-subunit alcohol dehydrogenase family)
MGARIVLVARDKSRGDATLARLRDITPDIAHSVYFADLLRLAEMKRVAAEIADHEPRIDVLINNAGALFAKRRLTEDGLERTFALNHMAYFVMTVGLRERLLASGLARIINTASAAHKGATLDFEDLQSAKSFGGRKAYGRSKLCNILFTREFARRLQGTGVTANCLHPGFVATRFGDQSGGLISFGSPSFLRYLRVRARKRLSISRLRQTLPRRRGNTFITPCRLGHHRGPRTTDLLYCSGSAARHWPA